MKRKRAARGPPDYAIHEAGPGNRDWDGFAKVPVHEVFTPPSELDGNLPGRVVEFDGSPGLRS